MIGEDVGMESESPSIDPRYRPEFQRGYSGAAAPVSPAPINRPEEPSSVQPIREEPHAVEAPLVEPRGVSDRVRRHRNPFLVIIVIASIAAIGVGTWLTVRQSMWGYTSDSSVNSAGSRFTQAVTFTFAGPLVTIGIAALLGVGFFIAARRS